MTQDLVTKAGEPVTFGREWSNRNPANGIQVIGSRWSGWSDSKDEKNGYTVPLYDEEFLKNYKKLIIEECLSRVDEATDWIYEYNHKKVEDYVMFHLGEKEITQ